MNAQRAFGFVLFCALSGGSAYATEIKTVRHVVLDPSTSTAASEISSWVFDENGDSTFVTTRTETQLTGSFDLLLTTYVWDEDAFGDPVQNPISETWIQFEDVNIAGLDANIEVDLNLYALLDGNQIDGESGACYYPRPPWEYCSGYTNGAGTRVTGNLTSNTIELDGLTDDPSIGGTTTFYHIEGATGPAQNSNAVPAPAPILILPPALALLFRLHRRRS